MTQRQEPLSWGQATECPPDDVSRGVFLQHFPYVAQGIATEPRYGLGKDAASRLPPDPLW